MPVLILNLLARAGIPARFSKFLAWLLFALIVVGLCWAALAAFRGWVHAGKDEAVRVDRGDVTAGAYNLVIAADRAASANAIERDEMFDNSQDQAKDATDEAARNRTSPLDALYNELRQ